MAAAAVKATEATDTPNRWEFIAGVAVFIVIVLGFLMGSYKLLAWITDAEQVPLEGVIIQGERLYTEDNEVLNAIIAGEVGSFFTADVDEIRNRIEALPWVYSASVRKEWPQRLRVFLVEQEPVGIWNEEKVMNRYGEVFIASPELIAGTVPHFSGPEEAEDEVLRQYQRISELLAIHDYAITRITLSERFSVRLWLDNGIELQLGREARLERIQRFLDLYPLIKKESDKAVAYADLRYDTGIAIGWKEPESE
ncbi:cell division septal protein [Idiomarina sp. A28L]|uniref:cell division protein FtsQ/DivIB n=1 Tax=Idiomarina sp. A28L TaxID=1036674 RepID=UPI00021387A5|nr:cell division protein FtsQ/DivIB [Idiomarina sp. A28L]EGN74837.1 cell division septal protein [Idiomarina sp. A28L]